MMSQESTNLTPNQQVVTFCVVESVDLPNLMTQYKKTKKLVESFFCYTPSNNNFFQASISNWHERLVNELVTKLQAFHRALVLANIPAIPPLKVRLCTPTALSDILEICFLLRSKTDPLFSEDLFQKNYRPLWHYVDWEITTPTGDVLLSISTYECHQQPREVARACIRLLIEHFQDDLVKNNHLSLPCRWFNKAYLSKYINAATGYCGKHAKTEKPALLRSISYAYQELENSRKKPVFYTLQVKSSWS